MPCITRQIKFSFAQGPYHTDNIDNWCLFGTQTDTWHPFCIPTDSSCPFHVYKTRCSVLCPFQLRLAPLICLKYIFIVQALWNAQSSISLYYLPYNINTTVDAVKERDNEWYLQLRYTVPSWEGGQTTRMTAEYSIAIYTYTLRIKLNNVNQIRKMWRANDWIFSRRDVLITCLVVIMVANARAPKVRIV